MSISALLSSSAAEGLFHRAVVQSGPPTCGSEEWAKRRSARFVEKVQEAPDKIRGANQQELVRKVLEDVAAPDLVSATQRMEPDREGLPLPFLPVVDGAILREVPPDAIRKNKGHRVPLMIGTNRDECTFFALGDPRAQGMDEEALHRRVAVIAGHDFAGPLVNQYRNIRSARLEAVTPLALWIAITTDLVFRMPSLGFAEAQLGTGADVFSYLFTWSSPFLGGILGSAHALEVPFVFGSVNEKAVQPYSGSGPAALALSEAMMRAWVAFASTGNPSCDEAGDWPVFGTEKRDTMVFGEHTEVQQDPRSDEREAWTGSGVDMANRLYQE
jgi:para-nitrobenzyl esterase